MKKACTVRVGNSAITMLGKSLYSAGEKFEDVVLREMVRNSISAHATNISVQWSAIENGEGTLTVIDNGVGMDAETLEREYICIGHDDPVTGQSEGSIDGYGVGKLSAWASKSWRLDTNGLTVGSDFKQGKDFIVSDEEKDSYYGGTRVVVVFESNQYHKYDITHTNWLSDIIRPEIKLVYNGVEITPRRRKGLYLEYETYEGSPEIIVRLNGIPVFYESLPSIVGGAIYFDMHTESNPYDDDYPVTVSRDGLKKDSAYYREYEIIMRRISEAALQHVAMLKEKSKPRQYDKNLWLSCDSPDISTNEFDVYFSTDIYTFVRYIKQLCEITSFAYKYDDFRFILAVDDEESLDFVASYTSNDFRLRLRRDLTKRKAVKYSKAELFATACHEFSHFLEGKSGWSYDWGENYTKLQEVVISAVWTGDFRK